MPDLRAHLHGGTCRAEANTAGTGFKRPARPAWVRRPLAGHAKSLQIRDQNEVSGRQRDGRQNLTMRMGMRRITRLTWETPPAEGGTDV